MTNELILKEIKNTDLYNLQEDEVVALQQSIKSNVNLNKMREQVESACRNLSQVTPPRDGADLRYIALDNQERLELIFKLLDSFTMFEKDVKLFRRNKNNCNNNYEYIFNFLLRTQDLVNAVCADCGSKVTTRKNKNLYIALSKLQPRIEKYVEKNNVNWRKNAINETNKYLKEGLRDRAVTRNLDWGIEIPVEGYEDKRMYVWIDAVLGYVTDTMKVCEERGADWKDWWTEKDNNRIYMVHAKDNITFHTIIFPGLLIGLEDGLKCPDRIVSAEYLNFNEQKFSKSKGIGLTILEALDRYNVDTLRFHLLRNGPETRDANFTEEEYIMTHNEITNKLGNFINRTLKFKGLTSIPVAKLDGDVEKEIDNKYNEIAECIEKIEFRNATLKIIELLDYANKYYDERKPWVQAKEDIEEFNNTMYTCACLIANISNIIEPFMPATAEKIRKYLNIEKCTWEPVKLNSELMLENVEPLFERM